MKHTSLVTACAAAFVVVASPARAQVADSAFITQVEAAGNMAIIQQVESQGNNYATIDQIQNGYYGYGVGNRAQVQQTGVGDSQVRVSQSGQGNDYTVTQSYGRNLAAFVDTQASSDGGAGGDYNTVLIQQSGVDSTAFVDNGFGSNNNHADVTQQGFGGQNQASIVQYGTSGSQASVYQAGGNLTGVIIQSGGGANMATIRQGY